MEPVVEDDACIQGAVVDDVLEEGDSSGVVEVHVILVGLVVDVVVVTLIVVVSTLLLFIRLQILYTRFLFSIDFRYVTPKSYQDFAFFHNIA